MMFMMMLSPRGTTIRRIANYVCGLALALTLLAASDGFAQSSVQGVPNAMQGFSQNRDQPIQIEAATLEMRDKKKEATFSGNVKVIQGDTTMTSKTLVVFYESTRRVRGRGAGCDTGAMPRPLRPKARRSRPPRPVPAGLRRSSGWKPAAMSWSPRKIRS